MSWGPLRTSTTLLRALLMTRSSMTSHSSLSTRRYSPGEATQNPYSRRSSRTSRARTGTPTELRLSTLFPYIYNQPLLQASGSHLELPVVFILERLFKDLSLSHIPQHRFLFSSLYSESRLNESLECKSERSREHASREREEERWEIGSRAGFQGRRHARLHTRSFMCQGNSQSSVLKRIWKRECTVPSRLKRHWADRNDAERGEERGSPPIT